ncbi:cysteine hydrolase [Halomicroarcula sp. S1AR25-4]|uniref:cysteine hydrolase family protein n=1 Tax=Haloarcula sp. S1AR25-4 TaxID=2950538 RepID=UPI0028741DDD|nr:isochorismatase family cysteine hydrolase [Halomicroarcula sp. S1AR25-4]MDS0279824.1 cysteine hydrolase [Halomicroarcula sp. S1AR25-4]
MNEYIRPHRDSAALLTIDTQNDFTLAGAPAEIDGTGEAVPQMQRLVELFRTRQAPLVHVVRLYEADGSNVDRCRRADIEAGAAIVRPGTDGAELVAELKPSTDMRLDADRLLNGGFQEIGPNEHVMYKPRWSAFHRTDLTDFLDTRSVDTIVVCGCNFPNCPRTTIYEASERDYRIVFVPDATSGVYERGVRELEDIGVAVKETEDVVDWMTE